MTIESLPYLSSIKMTSLRHMDRMGNELGHLVGNNQDELLLVAGLVIDGIEQVVHFGQAWVVVNPKVIVKTQEELV